MTEIFKFIHIAAVAIWAGGLVVLPFLFVQRAGIGAGHDLHRMHAMVRFFYVVIVSPSAFVAVASGTVLIFLQQTFIDWFTAKLFLVGALVIIHVISGLVILELFEEAGHYPVWRYYAITGVTAGVVVAILVVVTAKPDFSIADWGGEWLEPGALGAWLGPVVDPLLAPFISAAPR